MYRRPPDAATMAFLGLTAEDYENAQPFGVWPDNMTTVEVMAAMGTQWQAGFNGPTGLRYESLPVVLRMLGVPRSDHRDVFQGLRVMERTALAEMRAD